MSLIRIGVMGCAAIAERSVIPAIISSPNFRLIAVASRTKEKGQFFAERFGCDLELGYQNLLDRTDIDAIYMPLPTGLHLEWVTKSLHSNKHVYAEKSLALDYKSAQQMVNLARSASKILMENFMFIYHSQHQIVKELLKDGSLGDLRSFRSSFGFPPLSASNFRNDPDIGGGALLDAGAYTVRAAQHFLSELDVIGANMTYNEMGADVWGSIALHDKQGVMAQLSYGFDNFYQCNYELWCSKGKVTCERAFTPGKEMNPTIKIEKQGDLKILQLPADDHFANILEEFGARIRGGDNELSYKEVLDQSALLDEIKRTVIN